MHTHSASRAREVHLEIGPGWSRNELSGQMSGWLAVFCDKGYFQGGSDQILISQNGEISSMRLCNLFYCMFVSFVCLSRLYVCLVACCCFDSLYVTPRRITLHQNVDEDIHYPW